MFNFLKKLLSRKDYINNELLNNDEIFELQTKLLFAVFVAGKSSKFASNKIKLFLKDALEMNMTPFEYIKELIHVGLLEDKLKEIKIGRYKLLMKCLPELIKIDPKTCNKYELEKIPGIGLKTSRFFIMWSRPNDQHDFAVLDTHVLKFLTELGYSGIPKSTPTTDNQYYKIEKYFLHEAKKRNLTPRELDATVWSMYSGTSYVDQLDFDFIKETV